MPGLNLGIGGGVKFGGAGATVAQAPPATVGNGVTIGFVAPNHAAVAAFHAAALANGGVCEGPPGPRAWSPDKHYAYVRDADGNKLCAAG